jgi:hypothetical protein
MLEDVIIFFADGEWIKIKEAFPSSDTFLHASQHALYMPHGTFSEISMDTTCLVLYFMSCSFDQPHIYPEASMLLSPSYNMYL